jgi:hypothetical protein
MKIYRLLFLMLAALAGCTSTLKGSIGANQETSKSGSNMVSQTAAKPSRVSFDK